MAEFISKTNDRLENLAQNLNALKKDNAKNYKVGHQLLNNESIEFAEIKLDLAMLWATIHSLQDPKTLTDDRVSHTRSVATITREPIYLIKEPRENRHARTLKISSITIELSIKADMKN